MHPARIVLYCFVGAATLYIAYNAASPSPPHVASAPVAPPLPPKAPEPPPKTRADFDAAKPAMMAQMREALRTKDYYATLDIGNPWKLVADEEFMQLWRQVIDADKKATDLALAKLEKERKAKARKEGVRIGMSQTAVLESNWGKPLRINRTTTARTEREQWVYDGGYLYFENGVLTTIQN